MILDDPFADSVLAIDPGLTTGFVQAVFEEDRILLCPWQKPNTTCLWLWETLRKLNPANIICEDFEFRRNLAWAELFPVQLIGIVNLHVETFGHTDLAPKLSMQKASTIHGKGAYYDGSQKLKQLQIYKPGDAFHHSMDAMRHFAHWYFFGAGHKYYKERHFILVDYEWLLENGYINRTREK